MNQLFFAQRLPLVLLLLLLPTAVLAATPSQVAHRLRIFYTANVQAELNPCGG